MKSFIFFTAVILSVAACKGKEEMELRTYTVTVTNATANQPLSPPVLASHEVGVSAWRVGGAASEALEVLAEGGDASQLLQHAYSRVQDDAPLLPGQVVSYDIDVPAYHSAALSFASMLVNTNDAFTGVTDLSLENLSVGERMQILAPIYDAGTEFNSELQAEIPGPAAGGEGYSAMRNDVNRVAYHPGVVSSQDGLADSVLDATHRFDQGAVTIVIHRRQ